MVTERKEIMFCTNCGKEIIDTAKFCNFCGMPIRNMATSIPVQPVQPTYSQPVQSEPVYSQPMQTAPDYAESAGIPAAENDAESIPEDMTETADTAEIINTDDTAENAVETEKTETADISEAPVENTIENAETSIPVNSSVPTPNAIPTYGTSEPVYSAPPAYPTVTQTVNTIPVQSAEPVSEPKPERRYTLGHIMMCLAAVAVMAIVAGVFAGLYFSVV